MITSLNSENLSAGSIKGKATRLIQGLQSRFEPRNAVKYKSHHFEEVNLTKPTFCSQCKSFIWGVLLPTGITCKLCKLTCHPECVDKVISRCVKAQEGTFVGKIDVLHKFKKEFYIKPTYCDHCGIFITNIYEPMASKCDLKEGGCGLIVHNTCIDKVNQKCLKRNQLTKLSIKTSKISIDNFRLIRLLGAGSTSKVYLAKHIENGGEFAMKVIKKSNKIIVGDPESALSEMEALKYGWSFPFLTRAHYCFQSETSLFFVMEYVRGQDLAYHLSKGKFTEDKTQFYTAEIVLALNHLHQLNVVYRDLKLNNIILDQEGHCKLIDFGFAKKLYPENNMKTTTFCGSPSYISPEMIHGRSGHGFSVDWWALGVIMFEMLLDFLPFDGETEEQLYKSITTDEVKIPCSRQLTKEARNILMGLLIKDPQVRLGCRASDGYEEAIFNHPFFMFKNEDSSILSYRWNDIKEKRLKPPRVTFSSNLYNYLGNSEEKIALTPEDTDFIATEFVGFSYYSESFG